MSQVAVADDTHRHQCEVREWIKRRTTRHSSWLKQQLVDIEKKRGAVAANRLRNDIADQWKKGNRGEYGTWF